MSGARGGGRARTAPQREGKSRAGGWSPWGAMHSVYLHLAQPAAPAAHTLCRLPASTKAAFGATTRVSGFKSLLFYLLAVLTLAKSASSGGSDFFSIKRS